MTSRNVRAETQPPARLVNQKLTRSTPSTTFTPDEAAQLLAAGWVPPAARELKEEVKEKARRAGWVDPGARSETSTEPGTPVPEPNAPVPELASASIEVPKAPKVDVEAAWTTVGNPTKAPKATVQAPKVDVESATEWTTVGKPTKAPKAQTNKAEAKVEKKPVVLRTSFFQDGRWVKGSAPAAPKAAPKVAAPAPSVSRVEQRVLLDKAEGWKDFAISRFVGASGCHLKRMEQESGARLHVGGAAEGATLFVDVIAPVDKATAVTDGVRLVQEHFSAVERAHEAREASKLCEEKVWCYASWKGHEREAIGRLTGEKGCRIKELEATSGCWLRVCGAGTQTDRAAGLYVRVQGRGAACVEDGVRLVRAYFAKVQKDWKSGW